MASRTTLSGMARVTKAFSPRTATGSCILRFPPNIVQAPQARLLVHATSKFQYPKSLEQRRTAFGGNTSRNLLAHMEETATRNPASATAQNAFYQALLRANMPAIIVERYQTGQFATNAACDATYNRALGMLGQADAGAGAGAAVASQFGGQNSTFGSTQRQAVAQAVAAQARGGNVAVSRNTGSGAKETPLYVVIDETIGGVVFKWVKFFFWFALVTYISLVCIQLLVETLVGIRKIGPNAKPVDNQAKAQHQKTRFSDVHGCDEAKEELQELVDFLKNPDKFSTLGGKLPKGVLLVGPPGTGKTLLARAVAGEAGVPFFFMSGSEFDEVYVGVGARRVRELFAAAKKNSPAIVFIDELDAIGGRRNAKDAAYVKQTLNQLLTELDGFQQNSGVIILAATNFPELLDKALTRPGRFDRNVVVSLPDVRGRMAILKYHMKKIAAGKDVSLQDLASGTPGFSGAELENLINQAAVHASKAKSKVVSMLDLEWAKDKVMMGAEKKSMIIPQKEREKTAYHEAGHALVLMFAEHSDPLYKVTILPRGMALGVTFHLPEMDRVSMGKNEYEALLALCLGGKVAEELKYGAEEVTSGVSNDLEKATRIAYSMVTQFGMSPALGNVNLAVNYENLSTATKELIEQEVRRLIQEGHQRATEIITSKRKEMDLLANALLDYETLNREEAFKAIRGEVLEGKLKVKRGPIKTPELPPSGGIGIGGNLPGITPIPGTPGPGNSGPNPPQGGVVA